MSYCQHCGEIVGSSLCSHQTAEAALSLLAPALAEDILMALRLSKEVRRRDLVPEPIRVKMDEEFMSRPTTDIFCSPLNNAPTSNISKYSIRVIALMQYLDANA